MSKDVLEIFAARYIKDSLDKDLADIQRKINELESSRKRAAEIEAAKVVSAEKEILKKQQDAAAEIQLKYQELNSIESGLNRREEQIKKREEEVEKILAKSSEVEEREKKVKELEVNLSKATQDAMERSKKADLLIDQYKKMIAEVKVGA